METNRQTSKEFFLEGIDSSWNDFFFTKFGSENLATILEKLDQEWKAGACYPDKENVFRLFRELPLNGIKVIILGQDPYHQPGIADGFAFSTKKKNFVPASLRNIFSELKNDIGCKQGNESSDLTSWVKQGVFLLNTSLTVRQSQQLSHAAIWKDFIYKLLQYIDGCGKKIVWVFWGREARLLQEKCGISPTLSVVSAHPSPFSAHYGFFGSKPFSTINAKLEENGLGKIIWDL